MEIKIKSLFKISRLTKRLNGSSIFNVINSKVKEEPQIMEFTFNMEGITYVSSIVFNEIKTLMQSALNGNYTIKLTHSNPMINQSFLRVFR